MSTAATASPASVLEQFKWEPQPEAERWLQSTVRQAIEHLPWLQEFGRRLEREAGVRVSDLVGEIEVGSEADNDLRRAGWVSRDGHLYENPTGVFPPVLVRKERVLRLGLKVDSAVNFVATYGGGVLEHRVGFAYRRASMMGWRVSPDDARSPDDAAARSIQYDWYVCERHGTRAFGLDSANLDLESSAHVSEQFRTRRNPHLEREDGFKYAESLIKSAISLVGRDHTCDLFFAAEREYWQRRNRAAQVQKARQDRLGIGWANHDHHTYRSSRRHFARLIAIWEKLGFVCRERFYAGKEAGWGAQIMEQPNAGIITFNDVDLAPDELLIDFAHEPLPERKELGTVGLWCALHGESFLEAGMHHLECMFDFNALKEQLERDHGVGVMKPFTDFPYLKQAFTVGERWPVRAERIAALLERGQITPEQAEKFRTEGAIGSHLENLERNQGFKGFNQTGVSEIIAATDPRKHLRG
jgi:hypothetical protein